MIFLDIVERIFELADKQFPEQREFAAAIGVTPSIVSEWRRRKSASYVKRLEKISHVLGTTPQYLLSGGKSEEDTASKESRWYGAEFESQIPKLCQMLQERLNSKESLDN